MKQVQHYTPKARWHVRKGEGRLLRHCGQLLSQTSAMACLWVWVMKEAILNSVSFSCAAANSLKLMTMFSSTCNVFMCKLGHMNHAVTRRCTVGIPGCESEWSKSVLLCAGFTMKVVVVIAVCCRSSSLKLMMMFSSTCNVFMRRWDNASAGPFEHPSHGILYIQSELWNVMQVTDLPWSIHVLVRAH